MTRQEYAEYERRVAAFLTRENIRSVPTGPQEPDSEPYFTWSGCDCCGSKLGATVEDYVVAVEGGGLAEFAACQDCVYYLAYGQLDDMTMMDMTD